MTRRSWDDPWRRFPESKPIAVEGGLATSKQRGAMASTWWSKRFVEVLEGYGLGARMQRGRRYARSGQVVSFEVRPGQLLAQVQGSRATPYLATVDATPPTEAQWAALDEALASRVVFVARLLAGEVPEELEEAFETAGVDLFPRRWRDVRARCTCPDAANPCKHIAAALYLFADRLDADPWLLLAWRGRSREQVLAPLTSRGPESAVDVDDPAGSVAPWWPLDPTASDGLDSGSGALDTTGDAPDPVELRRGGAPEVADAVLQRLEDLPVEVQGRAVTDLLGPAYVAISLERDAPS